MNDSGFSLEQAVCGQVGRQLCDARESRGLTVSAVAERLHLRPSIVQAIETGEYEQVPGDLFLKGYVRSYAKLLGLDEDQLAQALDAELEPLREQREAREEASPLQEIQQRKRWRRRIATFVTLLMLGLVIWLIYYRMQSVELDAVLPEAGEPPASQVQSSPPQAGPALPAAESSSQGRTLGQAGASQPAGPDTLAGPEEPVGVPEQPTQVSDSVGQVSGEPAMPPAESESPTAGEDSLSMEFSADCWVEVRNARGDLVIAELKQAGERLTYEGEGPFRLVLGDVEAVSSLRLNGEQVDLDRFPARRGRAEFTLETTTP